MKPVLNNAVYNTALVFNLDREFIVIYWKMFSLLIFLGRLVCIQYAKILLRKLFCRKIETIVTS